MLSERDKYLGIRYATEEEINNYKLIESLLEKEDDDFFDEFLEDVSNYAFSFRDEKKAAYNKIRKYMKRFNVTAKALEDWYGCEEEA